MLWAGGYASVAKTIVDDVALAFSVFSLSVVFIKLRRSYKRNSDVDDET
jgi:hypothetical protein